MTETTLPPPTREQIETSKGPMILEFGAKWCGFCQAAQPLIAEALSEFPTFTHIKIEDGPGQRLGRSFKVKLWPTLIFMKDGIELARLVRPSDSKEIAEKLRQIV